MTERNTGGALALVVALTGLARIGVELPEHRALIAVVALAFVVCWLAGERLWNAVVRGFAWASSHMALPLVTGASLYVILAVIAQTTILSAFFGGLAGALFVAWAERRMDTLDR